MENNTAFVDWINNEWNKRERGLRTTLLFPINNKGRKKLIAYKHLHGSRIYKMVKETKLLQSI
jgi:hypothetical protein